MSEETDVKKRAPRVLRKETILRSMINNVFSQVYNRATTKAGLEQDTFAVTAEELKPGVISIGVILDRSKTQP